METRCSLRAAAREPRRSLQPIAVGQPVIDRSRTEDRAYHRVV